MVNFSMKSSREENSANVMLPFLSSKSFLVSTTAIKTTLSIAISSPRIFSSNRAKNSIRLKLSILVPPSSTIPLKPSMKSSVLLTILHLRFLTKTTGPSAISGPPVSSPTFFFPVFLPSMELMIKKSCVKSAPVNSTSMTHAGK